MNIIRRRILFVFFVLLFIILGAGVVYYTQGYRFDFSTFSIAKTGAVYIEANVEGYSVLIGNSPYQDKSGLLKKGTLISNIIPKKYRVVIQKDGYFEFEKNIEVFPSQVVRLLNVHLVPTVSTSTPLISDVKGDVIIDSDQNGHLLTLDSKNNIYYLYDANNPTTAGINLNTKISAITSRKISGLLFYPQINNVYIAQTSKGVYKLDMTSKTMTLIQDGATDITKIDGNNLYLAVQSPTAKKTSGPLSSVAPSKIVIYDLVLGSKVTEFILPFQSKQISDLDIGNNLIALLINDGSLYLYNNSGKQISQIAHSAKKMGISDDKTKIFFQDNDGKTFVYLFDEEQTTLDSPQYTTIRLNLIDVSHINNIWWYPDSFHLILAYPDQIYLAEVTVKDPNNRFSFEKYSGSVFYSQPNKMIYNLDSGTITTLDITKI
jgi:hypothetical protein